MARETLPEPEDFQDPLEDYEPKTYDDPLEQALAETPVSAIQTQPFVAVAPETPVHAALERLAGQCVACALVADEGRLVGVFSDRDALDRVALEYDAVKDKPVRDVMTTDPVFVRDDDCIGAALAVMAAVGYRHVPVLGAGGTLVGIVSPHRVVDFLQAYFEKVD
jgi:CBS domain-containing protein